jgi:small multidrug resistance family-3 protein
VNYGDLIKPNQVKTNNSTALLSAICNRISLLTEIKTIGLFIMTALTEIIGCYLPYLWLREGKSIWLLVPAAISLAAFAWLLSLHPTAAGRVYAAYGGVYIFVAILWLWIVDDIHPTVWDMVGASVALVGMAIIMFGPRST